MLFLHLITAFLASLTLHQSDEISDEELQIMAFFLALSIKTI
jgi:hypothetical protein